MEANIKQLTITGQAAEEFSRPRRSTNGGSRRKKVVQPQDDNFVPEDDEITSQIKKMNVTKVDAQIPIAQKPIPATTPQVVLQPPKTETPAEITPTTPQKVVLKPPRQQRVRLQPKAVGGSVTAAQAVKSIVNQTRKARRIKLTVANLNHRFTRAKKVKEHTEKETLDSVRDYLVKKGVIQAKSRAPEKMLRSMYADFMLLKDQAL